MRLFHPILLLLFSVSFASAQSLYADANITQVGFNAELPRYSGFSNPVQKPETIYEKPLLPPTTEHYFQNGKNGRLSFMRGKDQLFVDLSVKSEVCEKDLTPIGLTQMTPIGKPYGVPRFYGKLAGCDIFIDMLQDSAYILGGSCKISESCTIDASGLWGDSQAVTEEKSQEKQWRSADIRLNKARIALTKKLGNSQNMRDFLSEHLDFMANRQKLCEDYGNLQSWCSLRLTEIRAGELESRLASR